MMNLVETFSEFKDGKHLDRPTLVKVLEDVFRTLIKKKYGNDDNFDVIVNTQKGDLELWRVREIVQDGEVADELAQIAVSEAQSIDEDYEVGEECYEQMFLEDFGRRSVMAARQTLVSRIGDLEKEDIYKRYMDREGELVVAEVQQVLKRDILVTDEATGNELLLPRTHMIRGDFVRKGDIIRAIIQKVENDNGTPKIWLSRTSEEFLAKLMENEVPEIEDGIIVIRKIVRLPGDRAKVAVESYDERIDPVGACVGMKGSRIHGIVRELKNENIDIVPWTNNETLLIQRSLTPARVTHVDTNEETKRASVYLDADQVSLAIGRGGSNIKLAGRLSGYEIDVFRNDLTYDDVEDVDLLEFTDEIEEWILQELKGIGCDTARSVLALSPAELLRRTDLEEETIEDVLKVLAAEFEGETSPGALSKAPTDAEIQARAAEARSRSVRTVGTPVETPAPDQRIATPVSEAQADAETPEADSSDGSDGADDEEARTIDITEETTVEEAVAQAEAAEAHTSAAIIDPIAKEVPKVNIGVAPDEGTPTGV